MTDFSTLSDADQALTRALWAGDAEATRTALDAGAHPDLVVPMTFPGQPQGRVFAALPSLHFVMHMDWPRWLDANHPGRTALVGALLDHGADVQQPHRTPFMTPASPLEQAVRYLAVGTATALLRHGAVPDRSALLWIADCKPPTTCFPADHHARVVDLVRGLVAAGADPHVCDAQGRHAVIHALLNNDGATLTGLLQALEVPMEVSLQLLPLLTEATANMRCHQGTTLEPVLQQAHALWHTHPTLRGALLEQAQALQTTYAQRMERHRRDACDPTLNPEQQAVAKGLAVVMRRQAYRLAPVVDAWTLAQTLTSSAMAPVRARL